MRNFRIDVRYDGTDFVGWQVQPGERTVQGEIERVLESVLQEEVRVRGAGRTDTGVHALKMPAHFHSGTKLPAETIGRALGGLLPGDVALLRLSEAPDEFDARRHALRRIYRYRILRRRDPFLRRFVWEMERPVDTGAMTKGAARLTGEIDATSFAASTRKEKENTVTVVRSELREEGPEIVYEIEANRFVHHMVRNIVGTLIGVGLGKIEQAGIDGILEAKDRSAAGANAPARGLCLVDVKYAGD